MQQADALDPGHIARRIRRERDRRTKKLLIIGLVGVFVLYCIFWYLLTKGTADSPVFQLRQYYEQVTGTGEGSADELPVPQSLETYKTVIAEADRAEFVRALVYLQRTKELKAAGRTLWPLAARYPDLRPSVAREYYDEARLHRRDKPEEALQLVRMALAFNNKGIRENMLAAELLDALNMKEEAQQHRQLASKFYASWRSRSIEPPSKAVGLFLVFLVILAVTAAYYYWDELALVERLQILYEKAREAKDMAVTRIRAPIPPDESGVGTSPGDGMPETNLSPADRGSITGILKAEGFLKEVQDFFDQKNYELAVDMCQKAVELNPANAAKVSQTCLKEGVSLYDLGDFDQAIDLLEVCLHFAPHTVQAHLCLGNCFIKLGQYEKAQAHYEQVISITPQNTDAYYTLGVCYQKSNNLPKARRSFEVAVRLKEHPNSHFYLAKICETESDLEGAVHHWKRFIELAPDNPQAPSAKKRLEALIAQQAAGGAPPAS